MTRTFLALLLCFPFVSYSQPYPSKPIRLIVTYPAGGGADTMARLVAPRLSEALGQPILVENRGGASGTIAAEAVAKSAPDGSTLMLDATAFAVNPSLYPKLPYDTEKAFAPITLLALFPNVIVVHPSYPVSSVRELVAKIKAEPGKIAFASSGNGSAQHLAAELFKLRTGITLPGLAYAGAAPAIADTARGNAQLMFPSLFTAQPYLRSGKLRALAVAGPARLPSLPDLPTLAEAGVAGIELTQWYALFAPAKTPAPVVAQLNQALNTVLQDPEIIARFDVDGARVQTSTPEELHSLLLAERTKWRQVVQQTGLRMEPQMTD